MKRARAFAAAAATALGAGLAAATTIAAAGPAAADEVRPICYPVEGGWAAARWTDTYGAPRGTDRVHQGQDLLSVDGEKMLRLLSAVDGTVREIVFDNASGNRLVIEDADGWIYVYIHLNNDTPGSDDGLATRDQVFAEDLAVGQRVSRCEHVAYLGDSGNAEETAPHLHFEIRRPPADGASSTSWSQATPINPADSLRASLGQPTTGTTTTGGTTVATGPWAPFASVTTLVERQYLDFYGRPADREGARFWAGRLESGVETPVSFIGQLLTAPEFERRVAPVARLYWAYFDRIPDTDGLLHWLHETGHHGATLGEVSQAFAASPEFRATYGSLSDTDFVGLVYRNVLDRAPDDTGAGYWTGLLAEGRLTRGQVMIGFSESAEYRAVMASKIRVVLAYVAMLERSPDQGGLEHWAPRAIETLVGGVYTSPEYRSRVANVG